MTLAKATLAPIGITTYSRLDHLKKTIVSLQKNTLAKQSELYIFLDFPRKGDEEIVDKVRQYIYTVDGFKEVHIVEREKNDFFLNFTLGFKQLLDKYGKCIFMEDDNVASPYFLQYMNDGLDFYENDHQTMAICGFNVPSKYPSEYKYDYYFSRFFNATGFATWESRGILEIINQNNYYNELINDEKLCEKFKKIIPGLIPELKRIQEGKLNAGDYKITFHMIKNDKFVVKPIHSFVNNIGYDGSGIHCGIAGKFHNQNLNKGKVIFNCDVKYNPVIDQVWRDFFDKKLSFLDKVKDKIYKFIKKLK